MFRELIFLLRSISGALNCIASTLHSSKLKDADSSIAVPIRTEHVERCDYHYIVEIQTEDALIKSDPLSSLKIVNFFIAPHVYQKKIINVKIFKVYDDGR